jgi:nucleotide-binding universal stress UspA family protein
MSAEPAKRILMATDFSEGSERALTVAIRLAKALGATIDIVHIYAMPDASAMSPIPGVVPMPPPDRDTVDEIRRRLEEIAARVRTAGAECVTFSGLGGVAGEIVAQANRTDAELIIVGTHGRTGLRRVLLGSVAEDVLRKAHRPVLIVPPPREATA